jgi:hypothetical protein
MPIMNRLPAWHLAGNIWQLKTAWTLGYDSDLPNETADSRRLSNLRHLSTLGATNRVRTLLCAN